MRASSKKKLLYDLYVDGATSAEAREKHFVLLLDSLETEDLSAGPAFLIRRGLEKTYWERYECLAAFFETKMRREPDSTRNLRNYYRFLSQEEPQRALEVLDRILGLEPNNPDNHALNARIRGKIAGRIEDAEARKRENEKVFYSLIRELDLRGDDEAARGVALRKVAWLAYDLGRTDIAEDVAVRGIKAYGRSQASDPVTPEVFFNAHTILGLLALDRADLVSARRHLLESVNFASERPLHFVRLDLGWRLWRAGEEGVAREFVEKLVAMVGCGGPWSAEVIAFHKQVVEGQTENPA